MTPAPNTTSDDGRSAQRIAEALAILSLDRLGPVYACLDLAALSPGAFQPVLRKAIVDNRAEFARDTSVVPSLRRRTIQLVGGKFGENAAASFDLWLGSTFIAGPDDYRRYSYLQDVLRTASAWERLAIPQRMRDEFAERIDRRTARGCLQTAYPDDDAAFSDWDAEIYTRMRFYDEFRDPYDYIALTCNWIDFRGALDWFVANSDAMEQDELCRTVKSIGSLTESISRVYDMAPLKTVVRRYA